MDRVKRTVITAVTTLLVIVAWLSLLYNVANAAIFEPSMMLYIAVIALAVVGGIGVSVTPTIVWALTE